MCTVSMIGDHFTDKWNDKWIHPSAPNTTAPWPNTITSRPNTTLPYVPPITVSLVSKEEFEELKKEVLEMKQLLKRAVEYDEKNNEPHCETEEKIATLKKVAAMVGVSLDDVLKS